MERDFCGSQIGNTDCEHTRSLVDELLQERAIDDLGENGSRSLCRFEQHARFANISAMYRVGKFGVLRSDGAAIEQNMQLGKIPLREAPQDGRIITGDARRRRHE